MSESKPAPPVLEKEVPAAARRGRPVLRRIGLAALILVAAAVGYWKFGLPSEAKPIVTAPAEPVAKLPFNGYLTLTAAQQQAIGVTVVEIVPQTEPIHLPLLGTTKYDEDSLSRIRIMFKGRVDKVHVRIGYNVKRGDPLVDIYSTVLADAKSDYEIRQIAWEYQSHLLATREELRKQASISEQLYLETKNEEMRRRRELNVARDRLLIFGLTDEEIDSVGVQKGPQKAKLTIRAPGDGMVVERNVVAGNLYDESDTLLSITPVDHLWVWGNVFESDIDIVRLKQTWEIKFPFARERMRGQIEYISNQVDPSTHAVRVRTSIPNPGARLKSDMLVQGTLEIEPVAGRTVVPRSALVVSGGDFYIFVRHADGVDQFERRTVNVVHETADYAVVDSGLTAGEKAVTVGSLILSQLFEDNREGHE